MHHHRRRGHKIRPHLYLFLPEPGYPVFAAIPAHLKDTRRRYRAALALWHKLRGRRWCWEWRPTRRRAARYDHLMIAYGATIEDARQPWKMGIVKENSYDPADGFRDRPPHHYPCP